MIVSKTTQLEVQPQMLVISPASSYQKVALSIQLLFKENLFYISSFTYQEFFHGPSFYMADNFFINSSTNRQKRQSLIQLLFKQRSFYQFSFYLSNALFMYPASP